MIEGCDSNGCEYMTGGMVVILGEVGDNFAAGMTGGMAFIYDKSHQFTKKVNPESVVWQTVETDYWKEILKNLISEHSKETGSEFSRNLIKNYNDELINFIQVCPKEMLDKLDKLFQFFLNYLKTFLFPAKSLDPKYLVHYLFLDYHNTFYYFPYQLEQIVGLNLNHLNLEILY